MPHGRSATRDPHRGPTQGTHTEGTHTGDPHRGPAQGTHTGDPHRGEGPTETHHRRGGPHRGPTQNTHRQVHRPLPGLGVNPDDDEYDGFPVLVTIRSGSSSSSSSSSSMSDGY